MLLTPDVGEASVGIHAIVMVLAWPYFHKR